MNDDGALPEADGEIFSLRSRNLQLEAALRETQEAADRRLINAELRNQALRSGMIDLDGLKLIDPAGITVDEVGEVKGAAALMSKVQRDKPWLFLSGNSSSLACAPSNSPTRSKLATDMTLDEWRTARAELLRRR
jgi:hypothetical protein